MMIAKATLSPSLLVGVCVQGTRKMEPALWLCLEHLQCNPNLSWNNPCIAKWWGIPRGPHNAKVFGEQIDPMQSKPQMNFFTL